MFVLAFWRATLERAVKTFAQALAAVWAAGAVDVLTVDWKAALLTAAGATALSVLTSLTSFAVNPATGPSLGTETPRVGLADGAYDISTVPNLPTYDYSTTAGGAALAAPEVVVPAEDPGHVPPGRH